MYARIIMAIAQKKLWPIKRNNQRLPFPKSGLPCNTTELYNFPATSKIAIIPTIQISKDVLARTIAITR